MAPPGDDIITLSRHGGKNFPGSEARSRLDLALANRAPDDGCLDALERVLPPLPRNSRRYRALPPALPALRHRLDRPALIR